MIQNLIMIPQPASLAYAFSIGVLVSYLGWSLLAEPTGMPIDRALLGTMAADQAPLYVEAISSDLNLGELVVSMAGDQINIDTRWAGSQGATFIIDSEGTSLTLVGSSSEAEASTLRSLSFENGRIEYETAAASSDQISLTLEDMSPGDGPSILTIVVQPDGLPKLTHSIQIASQK